MKTIITILFAFMTLGVISQNQFTLSKITNTNTVFASAETKSRVIFNKTETHKVNLHLNYDSESHSRRITGIAILVGGVAFATAAILESGDGQIYQGETARQIMLGAGIGLTLTGFGLSVSAGR
jgi:hypothetical protein